MVKSRHHEDYKELIWALAKTDFTLRYQGSVLGYVWAILKPLFIFTILNFVFSSIFNPRNQGIEFYSLQLLVGILLYNFFAEGTGAGMNSLLAKSQLVTKIYVPRWTIIVAATVNAALVFLMNLLIIIIFFVINGLTPSLGGVLAFFAFVVFLYVLILSFGLATAALQVRFRDLSMIWEVIVLVLFYATPIIYPLSMMPASNQQAILASPLAFIVHFSKEGLVNDHLPDSWQWFVFAGTVAACFALSIWIYRKTIPRVAEFI
ncbi:MAG: ABC transporter permease [Candidatus Kerfeldbacteria bacterium]|nr:ABC transporter permease [Candidatus Kerfeldbacteria bacterium]